MSKTHRRPYCGITCAKSEKKDKQDYHQRVRAIQKTLIRKGKFDDIPQIERLREYKGGDWMFAKDGRHRYCDEDSVPG